MNQDGQVTAWVVQALGMSEVVLGKWVRAARMQVARQRVAKCWGKKTSSCGPNWRAEMERASLKKR